MIIAFKFRLNFFVIYAFQFRFLHGCTEIGVCKVIVRIFYHSVVHILIKRDLHRIKWIKGPIFKSAVFGLMFSSLGRKSESDQAEAGIRMQGGGRIKSSRYAT